MEYYKCKNMSYIFKGCITLKYLPDISKWNISNVTNITGIFENCSSIDLSDNEIADLTPLKSAMFKNV